VIFILFLGLALAGVSVAFAMRAAGAGRIRREQTFEQISAYGFNPVINATDAERRDLKETVRRIATAFGAFMARRVGRDRERELRELLRNAGFYQTSVTTFLGYRLLVTIFFPLMFLWLAAALAGLGIRAILGAICFGALGWVTPTFALKRKVRLRLEEIDYEVPELVDLLVTTVEAGVGFGAALQLSARRIEGPLGQELRLAVREQTMGLTVEEALVNMLGRADSAALRAFVQAILQGEKLGVSIGKILRDLAIDMRKRRRAAAEERAQKAPTKILFPLIFLIFPALFIVTLGPLVISFLHGLAST
jgi:tight adherence protein C